MYVYVHVREREREIDFIYIYTHTFLPPVVWLSFSNVSPKGVRLDCHIYLASTRLKTVSNIE